LIKRARAIEFGGALDKLRCFPLNAVSLTDKAVFFQFSIHVNIKGKVQNILGWGHPKLMFHLAAGPVPVFVGCTFKVVPLGFSQVMLIMVYLAAYSSYVTVFYVLLQSKDQLVYQYALEHCVSVSKNPAGLGLRASSITADFEYGLMSALRDCFPLAVPIFCLFTCSRLGRGD
jgi:hypothetical protein